MTHRHNRPLSDEELRSELESRHVVYILDQQLRLPEIERQVERLGFGETYIVSATLRPNAALSSIRLAPAPS